MNILCKYQKKGAFFFICVFRKYMFCVQVYWKWACRGRYNLFFEALKGLLLKNILFFLIFAGNVTLLSVNITELIPLRASTSKYKKSASSMWLYEGGFSMIFIFSPFFRMRIWALCRDAGRCTNSGWSLFSLRHFWGSLRPPGCITE